MTNGMDDPSPFAKATEGYGRLQVTSLGMTTIK